MVVYCHEAMCCAEKLVHYLKVTARAYMIKI